MPGLTPLPLVVLAILAACALVPGIRNPVAPRLDRLRDPSPAARRAVSAGVALVSLVYLVFTAFLQDRDLFPKVHDEHSYLLQMRMLAHGRLWMPPHELADFFDSFHILTRPKHCSIYFPGTALMYVAHAWAGLPSWELPVLAAAAVVALTYRCVTELVDGLWGLAAAASVLGVSLFRTHSTVLMSQMPAALLGMATVWAYLHWRGGRRAGWALAVGAFAGWAAVTRPVDALAFALPVAVTMALDLRRAKATFRTFALTAGALVSAAAPFLLLQAVFDLGVTGRLFKTPYVLYLEQSQPGSQFGATPRPAPGATGPASILPQKQEYYRQLMDPASWAGSSTLAGRLRTTATAALPTPLLLPLAAVGLFGMFRNRRWVLGAAVPLFFLLYLLNPYYLPHYTVPIVPAVAMLAATGGRSLEDAAGDKLALRGSLTTFLAPAAVALCLTRMPELDRTVRDEWIDLPTVRTLHDALPRAVTAPAVVLFRYRPGGDVHDEPVYNSDVAWPDDAAVVRAHDLGPRNVEIIEYFARRQGGRTFYRFDRGDGTLVPLGTAAELARDPRPATAPPPPATRASNSK